jgi:hypothetical protein
MSLLVRNFKTGKVALGARSDPQCDSSLPRLEFRIIDDEAGLPRSMHVEPRFAAGGMSLREVSILGAVYPAVWGRSRSASDGRAQRPVAAKASNHFRHGPSGCGDSLCPSRQALPRGSSPRASWGLARQWFIRRFL